MKPKSPAQISQTHVRIEKKTNFHLLALSQQTGLTIAELIAAAEPFLTPAVLEAARQKHISEVRLRLLAAEEVAGFLLEERALDV